MLTLRSSGTDLQRAFARFQSPLSSTLGVELNAFATPGREGQHGTVR